jgi:type IV pilus assembly protein PilC
VRVPTRYVVMFTRHLSTMLASGVQVVQCLETLSFQPESPNLGEIIRQLAQRIEGGHKFSHALASYPRVFSKIFVTMVQIGEETGALDIALDRLASWMEGDEQVVQKIKGALSYPAFVLTLAFFLTLGVFYTVLPAFVDIFSSMNMDLPLITRIVIWITNAIRNPGAWLVSISALGAAVKWLQATLATPEGQIRLFRLALKVPLVGGMLFEGTSARYCSAVSALLQSGMDLQRTFRLAGSASGSPLIAQDAEALVATIVHGQMASLHMMQHRDIYAPTLVHMVAAGEEVSRMPEMFAQAGFFHDMEMRGKVDALGAALEPVMLMGVASVVATIVLSIFLPMYSFMTKLS